MNEWWRSAVIYQIYPSPGVDHGYDVSDYADVDPRFGTLADFDELVGDAHELGLRVVIDIVPNHTSSEHPWFQNALSDPDHPDRARYVFRSGRDGGPPNNWSSAFGGPAWTLDEKSGEYYLHFFAPQQPDLDWHNEAVQSHRRRAGALQSPWLHERRAVAADPRFMDGRERRGARAERRLEPRAVPLGARNSAREQAIADRIVHVARQPAGHACVRTRGKRRDDRVRSKCGWQARRVTVRKGRAFE